MKREPIDPQITSHSRAIAQPKRQPTPAPVRHPVHPMCLAMSEVYQHVPAVPVVIGVDMGAPEGDKTVFRHSGLVPGVYKLRDTEHGLEKYSHFNGSRWSGTRLLPEDRSTESGRNRYVDDGIASGRLKVLELVKPDAPTCAPVPAKLEPGVYKVHSPGSSRWTYASWFRPIVDRVQQNMTKPPAVPPVSLETINPQRYRKD